MEISLALGGGGIKGFAHVGVIKFLVRRGFQIRAVAGTSIGGMVGAIFAAGHDVYEMEEHLARLDQDRLYRRASGDRPSVMGLAGVEKELKVVLGERQFDDLKLPFACTGVDLDNGQQVIMNRGKLLDAILATIAVPGIFPPRMWEGRLLVDGGVLDPVPVALARRLAPGLPVVAVVLSPTLAEWNGKRPRPRLLGSLPMLNWVNESRLAQSFGIFLRSVDIAGIMLTDLRLQVDPPEVIIRPDVSAIGLLDKVDMREMIALGEKAAARAMPDLSEAVGWRRRFISYLPMLSAFFAKTSHGP